MYLGIAVALVGAGRFALWPYETGVDGLRNGQIVRVETVDCAPAAVSIFSLLLGNECGFSALWRLPVAAMIGLILFGGATHLARKLGGQAVHGRWEWSSAGSGTRATSQKGAGTW
jgi:hypothetical protein